MCPSWGLNPQPRHVSSGNWTGNLPVHRITLIQLSHTSGSREESEERDEQGKIFLCPLKHVWEFRLKLECPLKDISLCFGITALAVVWRRESAGFVHADKCFFFLLEDLSRSQLWELFSYQSSESYLGDHSHWGIFLVFFITLTALGIVDWALWTVGLSQSKVLSLRTSSVPGQPQAKQTMEEFDQHPLCL